MSNNPENHAADGSAAKKRKRKRSKKVQQERLEPVFVEDVRVNRTNKKTKFDQDEQAEAEKFTPSEQNNDALTIEESGTLGHEGENRDSESNEANSQERLEVEVTLREDKHHSPSKTDRLKPKKAGSVKKKTIFFDGEDEDDEDEDDEEGRAFRISQGISRGSLAKKSEELLEIRKRLPIYQHKDKILDYVSRNQVTVIIGETGSGKSTQIPQFLMPMNKKKIAVTQPRRVAAASLASRVSEEYGCVVGQEVGYQVRFSNLTSNRTKLNYLTDGMLIRELMLDSTLSKYSTIVIDEAHERTVLTDLILGFLKQLILNKKRKDLKVIVMSATLNADLFSQFFDNAPILYIEGKMYPVSRHYLSESSEDIVDTMIKTVVQLNMSEQEGDVLCFLPGQEEIDNCVSILNTLAPELPKEAPLIVALPLYAALSPGQQSKIFEKLNGRKRKVILATNIAETSITVSGVKYVIDSGLRKVKVWKHQLGLSSLLTTPISQASAKQRAGRAGRESAGKVFRLYSEKLFLNKLPKQQESEILRNDIILPVLTLKKMGVDDLLNWSWLEHPGRESILSALNTLYALGALDNAGAVTPLGIKMAVLPLPPALSAVLISALEMGVLQDVIDIVSCLSVENVILNVGGNGELRDEINMRRRQYCPLGIRSGDLIALKEYFDHFKKLDEQKSNVELKLWCKDMFFSYKGFRNVMKVRKQLTEYMTTTIKQDDSITQHTRETQLKNLQMQLKNDENYSDDEDVFDKLSRSMNIEKILKAFLKGFALNTAIGMPDRSFRTCATGQLISIHPSSNLFGKSNMDAVMFIEYVYTAKAYGRNCSKIELGWLQEVAPHLLGGSKININE
ncbi:hypothetical protein OXX59_007362 [Metschnikowia pulcherrima]